MRVQSIRAAIQVGHIAGNRLFCLAVKMALRKMHAIAEGHYLAQEIRAMAEALQYPRHLLPARVRAPFVIDLREFAGRVCVFDEVDLVLHPTPLAPTRILKSLHDSIPGIPGRIPASDQCYQCNQW